MDQDIFNTKGINGHIYLYEQKLLIERKGFLAAGLKSKELSFNDFSSIEIKEATSLVNGFIKFTIPGKNEHIKDSIKAGMDEYSVTFRKKSNEDFLKLKRLIEEQKEKYISEKQSSDEKKYCSECGNLLSNKKDTKSDIKKTTSEEKNEDKKEGRFKKALIILLALMLPPVGIFFIFKSNRFKNTGKIIASIWLGVFLLMWFVDTDDKNTKEVASQQIQQEVAKDNTEKPQSTLSKMINGSDDKKDYNAIIDFISQNPTMGKFISYEETSRWLKGKRYFVTTYDNVYLFYLHENKVVSVNIKDQDGMTRNIYHEDIPKLPENVKRTATEILPKYIIISQMDLISGGRHGSILVESYSTDTPMDKREGTLRSIMKKEGFIAADLYCTREAYKANYSSSYNESHPDVLDKGYLGGIRDNGKFLEPIN